MHAHKHIKGTTGCLSKYIFPTVSFLWIFQFFHSKRVFFFLFFLHVFLVSTYMVLTFAWWNTGTSSSTEMLCSSPHHALKLAALHTVRQLCSLNSGCDTVPIVSGKQEGTGSYTVEMQCSSVVIRENNGTLSAKCVWLSQIANYRQRRWAGTGQAQCLHKHTSIHTHTGKHKHTNMQTCCAVGRVNAQKLQNRLHSCVVQ